jgi:hypothetical protein
MRETDCELSPTRSHSGNRTSAGDGAPRLPTFQCILVRMLLPNIVDRWLSARILLTIAMLALVNAFSARAAEVPMNMVVGSTGQMRNDGKGPYSTGVEWVAIWLEPSKWPRMSFDFCMNWPFHKTDTSKPLGPLNRADPPKWSPPTRTVEHHLTVPVPEGGGTSLGVFTSPAGNDLVISKPMTATVNTFPDLTVGASVSPDSAEVRFCNSDCSEYYSLIFGAKSVFYPELKINGARTTKATVTRTSDTSWAIIFPPKSVGRLWRRSGTLTDLGLYYYEGRVDIRRQ